MAHKMWPTAAMPGEAGQELPNPKHFEQLAGIVTEDMVAERVVCGPDMDRHAEAIQAFIDAGYDHVYVHQVGPKQEAFLEAYAKDILPRYGGGASTGAAKRRTPAKRDRTAA